MRRPAHNFSLALVTGASSGLGEALCYLLAKQRISIILHGRDKLKLEALEKALSSQTEVSFIQGDLSTDEGRKKVLSLLREKAPDLVINSAGFGLYGALLSEEEETSLKMIEVNCTALMEVSREAALAMRKAKREGVIVNIASAAAFVLSPGFSVYSATKAFVTQFSGSFDEEVRSSGIRVLTACPGMIDTRFSTRAAKGKKPTVSPFAMTATKAARLIWWQIGKRKAFYLFDWKYRLGIFLCSFLPKCIVARGMSSYIEARIKIKGH